MNLLVIYSKTAEGLRVRKALFGGLTAPLKRVIDLVDGNDSVQAIIQKLTDMSEQKVIAALTQLEKDGYIKFLAEATTEDDWGLGTVFSPMLVEEIQVEEELDFPADLALSQFNEIVAANRLEDERKAKEIERQIRLKEQAKAETENRPRLDAAKKQVELEKKKAEKLRLATELKKKQEAQAKVANEARSAEELRQQQEAENKVRAQAERVALEAEDSQRQAEEKIKKAELEAQAIVEKIRAKEKARREQVRQAKAAEAVQKKAELEAKAAEEVRIVAELQAQQEKAAKEQAEAEARAIEEAKERGRLEAERIARETEESQRQLEVEAQAKAAEKTRIAAEQQAQQEMAAKIQAEAEARAVAEKLQAQQEAEARAQEKEVQRLEKSRIAQEKADEKARIKAQKEAEHIAKKEQEVALAAEKKAKKAAENQAKLEAKLTAHFAFEEDDEIISRAEIASMIKAAKPRRRLPKIKLPALNLKTWVKKFAKFCLVCLPITAILLLGLMHVISLNMLNKPIENIASASFGLPVKVGDVRASVWPQPHFKLSQVTVGEGESLNIAVVKVAPVISTLFSENKQVNTVTIEGLTIDQHNAGLPLQALNQASKYPQLNMQAISFKQVKLIVREFALGTFDGDIRLNATQGLAGIEMKNPDKTLSIDIMPQAQHYSIVLTAKDWATPVNSKLVLDELNARGTLADNQVDFEQINGEIYGGKLTAKASVDWAKAWQISGDFKLSQANTADMLKAFASTGSVIGKMSLHGQFSGQANTVELLADATSLNASFETANGKINGVDIAHAIVTPSDKSLEGYNTPFDKLTGNVQLGNGQFQYSNLVLRGDKLQAQGRVEIDNEQNVSGKFSANLATSSRSFNELFNLTGKVNNVKRK